jgi:hypothetical protein
MPVEYSTFPNGLSGLSKAEQNKFQTLDNIDIHSETGFAMPQYAMTTDSTTPNEPCVSASDQSGNAYFFSTTTGKIWKRATNGTYSLIHTNANTAHRGARYFNGYLWYWTATKLGHFDLASTWTDSFATFTNGDARGSIEHANSLLIGDGKTVARVDSTNTFSGNELPLPAQFKVTDLISLGDDVLVGTYVSTDTSYCKTFLWDSVSPSYTSEDEIFEKGVNFFLQVDNLYLAQCGTQGKFYYWTGAKWNYFGKVKGITTGLGEQMKASYKGRALFANATKIYSIHREDSGLPIAFCGEYTCTGTIESVAVVGDTLLASVGTGVDKVGTSFATGTIITPEAEGGAKTVVVSYDSYPDGISIYTSVNGAAYVQQNPVPDTTKKTVSFNGGVVDGATITAKVVLTPSGANRPIIKGISIV